MSDRNDTTSKPHAHSDEDRRWLANALATWVKPGDIAECDCCEAYCLEEHVRIQYGSMGKEARLCPKCDLEWSDPSPESSLAVARDEEDTSQRAKDSKKRGLS